MRGTVRTVHLNRPRIPSDTAAIIIEALQSPKISDGRLTAKCEHFLKTKMQCAIAPVLMPSCTTGAILAFTALAAKVKNPYRPLRVLVQDFTFKASFLPLRWCPLELTTKALDVDSNFQPKFTDSTDLFDPDIIMVTDCYGRPVDIEPIRKRYPG
jgi:dTDP-4-amino-4,6-dideoxygalactose transaminase